MYDAQPYADVVLMVDNEADKIAARASIEEEAVAASLSVEERAMRDLLPRHQRGDSAAFPEFVQHFRARIYSYLLRCGIEAHACDDLFQEVFLALHRNAGRYSAALPLSARERTKRAPSFAFTSVTARKLTSGSSELLRAVCERRQGGQGARGEAYDLVK